MKVLRSALPHTTIYTFIPHLVLFAAHLLTAQAAYYIYQGIIPAIIWPAAGVALAGLVIYGRDLWPAITIASLTNSALTDQPGLLAVGIAAGSTLQAYFGAYLLERFQFDPLFRRLSDGVVFIVILLGASAIGPVIITSALTLLGLVLPGDHLATFGRWWLASCAGFIIFGSFIMRWLVQPVQKRTYAQWVEAASTFVLVCCLAFILSWTPYGNVLGVSLIYVLLAPFLWIAFRIGPRAMTLSIIAVTLISLTGVTWGWEIGERPLSERIISAETLSMVWAIIFLLLVSANEERKEALKSFADQVDQLGGIIKRISADEQMKTEFLATLAHELRNPLAPILSSIELMRFKGSEPDERTKILTFMEERVGTMGRLLDDLLDISRITQKKLRLRRQIMDIRLIAEQSIASVKPLLESKEHTLAVVVPLEPLYMQIDPVRIEQIIVNLLTNAAKYTDRGGSVTFSIERKGEEMELRVKDTGIGISSDMMGLIFEPFAQLSGERDQTPGLGIGLSLTKRLAELHDGTITAESEGSGKGTEFIVQLPAPMSIKPIWAKAKAQGPASALAPMRVLVVDDNVAAAEGIGELLRIKKHEVVIAYNGKDALAAAASFKPEAIVLDIGLPDMNGHEVARTLLERGSTAFLIALTGYGQEEDKQKAKNAGFARHLTKPVSIAELENILEFVATSHYSSSPRENIELTKSKLHFSV